MGVGRQFRDQQSRYEDPISGREVTCLTNWPGHSWQFYFTHPCWIDGGRAFLFHSERDNASNYFRYELATGEIVQLTDLQGEEAFFKGCLCPATGCFYYWSGAALLELQIDTPGQRQVFEVEPPFKPDQTGTKLNVSADGRHVVAVLPGVPEGYDPLNLHPCYTPPLTRLARIDVASGVMEVLLEERRFIGHLNTSPARSELMTYTHEGPISVDDQRIHGLNLLTGEIWVIRPERGEYRLVAEHWFADGETLGFRCHSRSAGDTRFGSIRHDNRGHVESVLPYSRHFHSLDGSLVVGDGTPVFQLGNPGTRLVTWPCILLHPWEGEGRGQPQILAYHGSSFNGQRAHPHAHITPDGRNVLFTTNRRSYKSEYSNIHMVPLGDLQELPALDVEKGVRVRGI
ncbi:MAG: oligogalacturonate lyase family protein [Anaerolineaceae bacterium]|nr:oligogalacturonate lyase family protein [Anaerolineaceae bacterium]